MNLCSFFWYVNKNLPMYVYKGVRTFKIIMNIKPSVYLVTRNLFKFHTNVDACAPVSIL